MKEGNVINADKGIEVKAARIGRRELLIHKNPFVVSSFQNVPSAGLMWCLSSCAAGLLVSNQTITLINLAILIL
jgi:hypothetical protein